MPFTSRNTNYSLLQGFDEYIDDYIANYALEYDQVPNTGKHDEHNTEKGFFPSARFKHYCLVESVLAFLFLLCFGATFALPRGILSFILQFKSISLTLSTGCCIIGAYFTDLYENAGAQTAIQRLKEVEEDQVEKKTSQVFYLALHPLEMPFLLEKVMAQIGESAFVGFDQVANLVLLHELFVLMTALEVVPFCWTRCLGKIAAISCIGWIKDVTSRLAQFFIAKNGSVNILVSLLHRVIDAIFSFLLAIPIAIYAGKVIRIILKSQCFQRMNSSKVKQPIFRHPVMNVVVSMVTAHLLAFSYYLAIVIWFAPNDNIGSASCVGSNQDGGGGDGSGEICIDKVDFFFWSVTTDHQVMPQFFVLLGILSIYLSRCLKQVAERRKQEEQEEANG